jgi:Flagellar assembly protein FliH
VAADFIPLADYLRPRPARENAPPDAGKPDDGKVIPLPVRRVTDHPGVERVVKDPAAERVEEDPAVERVEEGRGVERLAGHGVAERGAREGAQSPAPTARCDAGATSRGEAACTSDTSSSRELVGVLREARVFRARLADACDEAAARLVRELAAQVLVRELRLAPCEIAELVARARERLPVLRVRVSPGDATRMHGTSNDVAALRDVPVIADDQLEDGDAILEVAGGVLDARLGVRLADVLEAFA